MYTVVFNENVGRWDVRLHGVFTFSDVSKRVCDSYVSDAKIRQADHDKFTALHFGKTEAVVPV